MLIPWRPRFDPYREEIIRADLWIRIPNFPLELFNTQSATAFVRLNNLGEFIRLEHFTIIKNKLKFTRICVNIDITTPLPSSASIPRDGVSDWLVVWYEDFSTDCACCGLNTHTIVACPLIQTPKQEAKIIKKKVASPENY